MKKLLLSLLLLGTATTAHAQVFHVTTTITTSAPVGLVNSTPNAAGTSNVTISSNHSNLKLLGTPNMAVNVVLSNATTNNSSVVVTNDLGQANVNAQALLASNSSNLSVTARY